MKFAKLQPPPGEARGALETAIRIVESDPAAAAAPTPGGGAAAPPEAAARERAARRIPYGLIAAVFVPALAAYLWFLRGLPRASASPTRRRWR